MSPLVGQSKCPLGGRRESSSSGLWNCGNRVSDFQGAVGRGENLSLPFLPCSLSREVFHAFHRPVISTALRICRVPFFRPQRPPPGMIRRRLARPPNRSLLRLRTPLRLRPVDLVKGHRAVLETYPQLTVPSLLDQLVLCGSTATPSDLKRRSDERRVGPRSILR